MIEVEQVKQSMRISHTALDEEIKRNIRTCLDDLYMRGVNIGIQADLIDKACELYCKWQYDYQGKGEQYCKNYESLRDSLSLAGDYNV